ncbi:hypothetical protein AVEN_195576-1 [Araneus ventricosus]|uniref:MD-2-related lipid-recognition domain-containing protein n=2 Tax=Araneus ventricosus TaxID=182803 RepID=A0A4Y2PK27_ARAVE|nr:hypothetical protein AVEN_195576-1 [Araneus ventricosus]
MKTLLFMLSCFYLIVCSIVQAIDWDKCGSGKQIIQLWKLRISPDPIHLSGKEARVSVQADLYEDIPYGARVHIKIWKVTMGGIYIPGPCFLPTGCDVELCSFLEYFSGESVCPVKAGLYESNDNEFDIPEMGSVVKWFASGFFWIELKMTGPNSEQLTCWSFKGEAKQLFSPWNRDVISLYMKNETSV